MAVRPLPNFMNSLRMKAGGVFLPDWWNWQTRWIQNPLPARASRFKSEIRYSFFETFDSDVFEGDVWGCVKPVSARV